MADYYRMVAVFDPLKRPQYGRADLDDWAAVGDHAQGPGEAGPGHRRRPPARTRRSACRAAGLSTAQRPRPTALKRQTPDAVRAATSWSRTRRPPPATHILLRGHADPAGGRGRARRPRRAGREAADVPEAGRAHHSPSAVAGAWVASAGQPADGPGDRQPRLAVALRRRPGPHRRATSARTGRSRRTRSCSTGWPAGSSSTAGRSSSCNRLILQSNTYRQASADRRRRDADRGRPREPPPLAMPVPAARSRGDPRLVLAVTGRLNRQMSGPGVFPPIPKEALEGHSDPKTVWTPSDEWSASRRTIYAVLKRSLTVPLLETLDLCDTARSTAAAEHDHRRPAGPDAVQR